MAEVQKISVAVTAEQVNALRDAVETGEYATTSEVVREALRDWLRKHDLRAEELKHLREQWKSGKASGAARTVDFNATRAAARRRLKKAIRRSA
jgi:antitoxin ParD1/3/4